MKNASKIGKEAADVARAAESVEVLQERLDALQAEFDAEITTLQEPVSPERLEIEKRSIRPRKSDISVGSIALCWTPWRLTANGTSAPA
jgi:hypothetical protein